MIGTTYRNRRQRRRGEAGFTLVELLVVLVILALLGGLVGPQVLRYAFSAKTDTARLQIQNFEAGLDLYRLHVGRYPTGQEGLQALVARPSGVAAWNGPYLKGGKLPDDPWGRPYGYRNPGEHSSDYDIFSLGADGVVGGDGDAQDVGNWQ
ncbi:type II secretion system major pseudopilin GspG [Oceanibacterium hippocampi]|uniref:Type II secretion system core protein G n=1 Tax=Oceanibacterium hippocampi TaxID=745714 RepID=A0A1Y5T9J2_9PROT|nr:type II secretion system major pseudopilin GspG [Oceanibacterium hippocampi]SLN56928.1 Type II secretion system protein G precursor [Oceanibacterium hippocampi]